MPEGRRRSRSTSHKQALYVTVLSLPTLSRDGARFSVPVAQYESLRSNSPFNKPSEILHRPRNAELSQLWKIGQAPCSHTKGVFGSPAPSRVAVARSFERHVPTTASSNLHTIAAMRVASRVAPQCFCLRVRACEYQASNCELQVGVAVVEYGFMLQTRARNPKLRPSADGHEAVGRYALH